jgi:hypothetical protein
MGRGKRKKKEERREKKFWAIAVDCSSQTLV